MLLDSTSEVSGAVDHVRHMYPWYDALLRKRDDTFTGSLADLPLVDASLLERHYYGAELPTDRGLQVYLTSGTSSGHRKRVTWTQKEHMAYVDRREAIFRTHVPNECKTACADLGTGHAAASAMEIFERMGLEAAELGMHQPIEKHVETLNAMQPDMLFSMPMIVDTVW